MFCGYGSVCTDKGAFDIAEHRIDPLKCAVLQGFVAGCQQWLVNNSLVRYRREAGESIRDNPTLPP